MMSSGLIRGQADANDVSPSGKLMLKYGPGWTIRGAQTGPMGTSEEARSGQRRGLHDDQARRGDEIVTGSINESSGEILRGREYRRSKLDRELKGWVMKGSRSDEWLESKCERVRWALVPHNWSWIKLYLSSPDHSWVIRLKMHRSIGLSLYAYCDLRNCSRLFENSVFKHRFLDSTFCEDIFAPNRLFDKTDSLRIDEFSST